MIALSGDFRVLLARLDPVMRRIAYRVSRRGSMLDADDLIQESRLHLWDVYNAGTLTGKTDSYILQGCYFHLKNYLRMNAVRSRQVHMPCPDADMDSEQDSAVFEGESAQDVRHDVHERMLVETIMSNGFTPREKHIFKLLQDNLTTREIGGRLGISHVMVVKIMRQVREKAAKYRE
jgi:RNA polymerase sigma factor (sigma-70 family)